MEALSQRVEIIGRASAIPAAQISSLKAEILRLKADMLRPESAEAGASGLIPLSERADMLRQKGEIRTISAVAKPLAKMRAMALHVNTRFRLKAALLRQAKFIMARIRMARIR